MPTAPDLLKALLDAWLMPVMRCFCCVLLPVLPGGVHAGVVEVAGGPHAHCFQVAELNAEL